ncbi:MAG TPA: amidohydrolase family protein [Mycobacteriales bacterium]|nr:amidohydrolase family protein [Mycobacteriales bacterium]
MHVAPVVLPVSGPPIRDGAVVVDGDRIAWVGHRPEWTEPVGSGGPAEVVEWPGVLAPGLVNAHCHLQYTAYADKCQPGVDFLDWIAGFPARNATMTEADWRQSTVDGVAALLATGTTAVADIAAHAVVVDVLAEAGLAGISYVETVGVDDARWPDRRARLLSIVDRESPRAVGISPHTLYTLGTAVVRDCVALARDRGLRLHPHAAESAYEVEYVATGTGPFAEANRRWGLAMELIASGGAARTPIAELAALGTLGPDSHVAHGVHADAADRATLRGTGTAVTLCPRSNVTLGVGAAPVAAYRAEGNPVAVGTDGLTSAPSLDLLADLAALRTLALRQGSPAEGLDQWLVEAATLGGAGAMGLTDVGVLRPGARADLAAFDVPVGPGDDPYRALVHGAGSCAGTVLGGRIMAGAPGAGPAT